MLYVRMPFSECPDEYRGDISFDGTVSMTKQSFAAECDFNNIMAKYVKTGVLPENVKNPASAIYADVSDMPSYMEAQQVIINAGRAFASLSSDVRDYFANDPVRFLDFMDNLDKNRDMAVKLGLVPAGEPERSQEAGVGSPAEPPKEASK